MISSNGIQKWLSDEGMFRKKIDDETANFHFSAESGPQNFIDIVQPKGKKDCLVIGTLINVSPEHLQQLQLSTTDRKEIFLWNIRLSLNKMAVDFTLNHPNSVLQSFTISDIIFEDGLTKDRFIDTIRKVIRAKLQGVWLVQKEVGTKTSGITDSKDEFKSYG
jgi:hypothetical protein